MTARHRAHRAARSSTELDGARRTRASATSCERGRRAAADRRDRVDAGRARAPTGSCSSTGRTAPSARGIRSTSEEGKTAAGDRARRDDRALQYFTRSWSRRRRRTPRTISITLFAHAEVDGEPLPPMDVLALCLIIVVAGNETTRNGDERRHAGSSSSTRKSCASSRPTCRCCRLGRRGGGALDEPDHPLRAHRDGGRPDPRP